MLNRYSVVLILVTVALVTGCGPNQRTGDKHPPEDVNIPFTVEGLLHFERADGSAIVDIGIEIADDDSTRTRGLMQRGTIPDTLGMLFIFPRQETRSFWMANTPHSLDILFVDANREIVDIAKYTRPFSPESITSREPSIYVVEVRAGFTDSWGIIETDKIRWETTP